MQHVLKIARALSWPAILIAAVWCAALIGVAVGPIDFSPQPSLPVLALVATGVSLFILAYQAAVWSSRTWLQQRPEPPALPVRLLNITVATSSTLGLAGIALIALDRVILSGVSNGGYSELLRCAPDLVDFIEIKRTPLLYLGYLTFSFGFVSLVLFLLRGEEIRGWPAILAQLSILSPVGYAILYSGRMPILFIIVLIAAALLVRIGLGRPPLPRGHHLLVKMVIVLLLFAAYSSAMWSSRQAFCVQMSGLIRELQVRMNERDLARTPVPQSAPAELKRESPPDLRHPEPDNSAAGDAGRKAEAGAPPLPTEVRKAEAGAPPPPADDRKAEAGAPPADVRKAENRKTPPLRSVDSISAADLSEMVGETKALPAAGQRGRSADTAALLAKMQEAWHVRPREYVLSAIESGRLSLGAAVNALSTYYYLTHGIRILDITWHEKAQFTRHWGVYEIGILSPILRVFFPQNQLLASMSAQLKSAGIYGFFPTVWAAAYIDFGAAGAVIYILIWGFAAGWSAFGARHSARVLPPLLLTFILASILLSPVQGPLGIANSAMVLVSMVIVGLAIDLASTRLGRTRLLDLNRPQSS